MATVDNIRKLGKETKKALTELREVAKDVIKLGEKLGVCVAAVICYGHAEGKVLKQSVLAKESTASKSYVSKINKALGACAKSKSDTPSASDWLNALAEFRKLKAQDFLKEYLPVPIPRAAAQESEEDDEQQDSTNQGGPVKVTASIDDAMGDLVRAFKYLQDHADSMNARQREQAFNLAAGIMDLTTKPEEGNEPAVKAA